MRLEVEGLAALRERLARMWAEGVLARAMTRGSERMAAAVRDELAEAPGAGEHDAALRDSVGARAEGLDAVVGSNDPEAAAREIGSAAAEPRPFLAPVAARMGEELARSIGSSLADSLRADPAHGDPPASDGREEPRPASGEPPMARAARPESE